MEVNESNLQLFTILGLCSAGILTIIMSFWGCFVSKKNGTGTCCLCLFTITDFLVFIIFLLFGAVIGSVGFGTEIYADSRCEILASGDFSSVVLKEEE